VGDRCGKLGAGLPCCSPSSKSSPTCKEWDDAFAHWQCFADGADSESDSDDEADPHADNESDTEERAYADVF
jgi:hypothetical protein